MQLSNWNNIGSIIKANLLFLALSLTIIVWTWYCVREMWTSSSTDLKYGIDALHHGNMPNDLPTNLTYMVFELVMFFLILRPETYHLTRSIFRCVFLLPIMINLWVLHMLALWHAGTVNATMLTWWTGLTGLTVGLLILGIILRTRQKKNVA